MHRRSVWLGVFVILAACDGPVPSGDAGADAGRDAGVFDAGDVPIRDAGQRDAAAPDAALDAGVSDAGPLGPVVYPSGRRHSPLTDDLALGLRAVAERDPSLGDDRFIKVGDSITVSRSFLHCYARSSVDLDGRTDLDSTLARFVAGDAVGTTSFDRTSLVATVGWSASAALAGDPTPLDQEHAAVSPRFAVLMFGSNDVGFRNVQSFARDIWTITDTMLERGTIPLLSTFPPRDDSAAIDRNVPLFNLAVRAIAQGRGVPLVDYHRELLPLPSHGLGGDGVHPNTYGSGACRLTPEGLDYGNNVRNLITLEQLDRAARALGGATLDTDAPRLEGRGTAEDPFVVAELPFAVMGDTSRSGRRDIDRYACSASDESGPELVYRMEVPRAGTLTAAALSASGVDVDVHLLGADVSADACVSRDDQVLRAEVTAGTWYVVADTFVGAGGARPGAFLLLLSLD